MHVRSRLLVVLALALALALVAAAESLAGVAKPALGTPSAAATDLSPDVDRADGALALVVQPLFVVALVLSLALVALPAGAPAPGATGEPRRSRAPPSL